jgi:hypothetical protein
LEEQPFRNPLWHSFLFFRTVFETENSTGSIRWFILQFR